MAANSDSGLSNGTNGSPQSTFEEQLYPEQASANESSASQQPVPKYAPSPKHEPGHNFGSPNPIKSVQEGQRLLDTGYQDGKQIYNVTAEGKIVKFQPDNTPNNGYHAYEVSKPRDIPAPVLKQMYKDGKITKSEYKKILKGKK